MLAIPDRFEQMRRFTRLTNGFSKKLESHIVAVSPHFMHYNFVRIHQTPRRTPAMTTGVTDWLWEIGDVVRLLDEKTTCPATPMKSPAPPSDISVASHVGESRTQGDCRHCQVATRACPL
jgi:hypothetical protein